MIKTAGSIKGDVRETPTPKNIGEVFFLDIPFYRTRHNYNGL